MARCLFVAAPSFSSVLSLSSPEISAACCTSSFVLRERRRAFSRAMSAAVALSRSGKPAKMLEMEKYNSSELPISSTVSCLVAMVTKSAHGSSRDRRRKRLPARVFVLSMARSRQALEALPATPRLWRALETTSSPSRVGMSRKTAPSFGRYRMRNEDGAKIISSTCST